MTHCDPETLALAALGEPIPATDAEHLAACAQCQEEVSELAALVTLGREAPRDLTPAPEGVWDAIQAELGLGAVSAFPAPIESPGQHGSAEKAPADGREANVAGAGDLTSDPSIAPANASSERPHRDAPPGEGSGQVIRLEPRRRLLWVASAAAMVGAMVGGTVVWAAIDRTPEAPRQDTIIAQAILEPLTPAVSEPGKAQVLETPDGLVVRVDARSLPPGTGFHEVWLLDANAAKLVALGALPSGSVGTFTVPPGVHVSDFPVVDISLEPYDGDPGHSHDSLLRGVLEA